MNPETTINTAARLLDCGLPRSAWILLDGLQMTGQKINSLRREACRRACEPRRLTPGVYALVTLGERGLVVPVSAEPGRPAQTFGLGDDALEATKDALHAARERILTSRDRLPDLRLILPEIPVIGRSLGLPAALAFLQRWSGDALPCPVLATGRVLREGLVLPVERMEEKLEAAALELEGTRDALVLVPQGDYESVFSRTELLKCVGSIEAASKLVWGRSRVDADPGFLSVHDALVRARKNADRPAEASAELEGFLGANLTAVDRARVLAEIGILRRHMGRTSEAVSLMEEARDLVLEKEDILGREKFETLEMETLATRMDTYELEGLEQDLRAHLGKQFALMHNRVRCNGMLAQVISTVGRNREQGLELRRKNLQTQAESDEMRREIPRTLACLVWEAARVGARGEFDGRAAELLEQTPPGDAPQSGYNACNLARGLVVLGRHEELLRWVRGEVKLWGREAPAELGRLLEKGGTIGGHPEVSTARAVARALRRSGDPLSCIGLAERLGPSSEEDDLVAWLAALLQVEAALAELELGHTEACEKRCACAREALATRHAGAARFHRDLVRLFERPVPDQGWVSRVEAEVDRVYY